MNHLRTIILIPLLSVLHGQNDWLVIGTERAQSVSGIAVLNNQTFIVHDNKRKNEIRLGEIKIGNDRLEYIPIAWPNEELPFDLEALTIIPNSITDIIAMESTGKCHWLVLNVAKQRLAYNGFIQLPDIKRPVNLEGFDLVQVGKQYLGVWGHRGKSSQPGKLYWGWVDFNTRVVTPVNSVDVTVDWPIKHVRHISDLKIDNIGQCWVSATSDPGDDGPFSSAVYNIGQFDYIDNQVTFKRFEDIRPSFKFEERKVEGFALINDGILVATDDENFGGYVRTVYFK